MRLVLQRVTSASVTVRGEAPGNIGGGLVILAGVTNNDSEKTADYMAEKAANLRIFDDGDGNMNLSLLDVAGECLCVSNFTLYADCKKGRRPSFINAAPPQHSEPLYDYFIKALFKAGVKKVVDGDFGLKCWWISKMTAR